MRKLLVCSQKGGVGKTTTAINLAGATASGGTRVLLFDADPLSNVCSALSLHEHPQRRSLRDAGIDLPGILIGDVVPGVDVLSPYDDGGCTDDDLDALLGMLATPAFQDHYGCLVVDTPPFMGPNPGQLVSTCDEFLLVMRAEPMAYRTLPAFLELMQRSKTAAQHPIKMRGVLLTLPEGEEAGGRWERELRGRLGSRILAEVVPHDEEVMKAGLCGHLVTHGGGGGEGPAAAAYHSVAESLELRAEGGTVEEASAVEALKLARNQSKGSAPARKVAPLVKAVPAPAATATVERTRSLTPPPMRAVVVPAPEPAAEALPPVTPSALRKRKPAPAAPPFPVATAAACAVAAVAVGIGLRFAPMSVILPGLVGLTVAVILGVVMRVMGTQESKGAAEAAPRPGGGSPPPSRRLSGLKRRLKAVTRDGRGG